MKLKNFASKKGLSEDDLIYAFVELGLFKGNQEPKNAYVKNGYFSDSGDVLDVKSVSELFDNNIDKITRAKDMKQIEELQEQVATLTETVNSMTETIDAIYEFAEKIDGLYEVIENISAKPKKEKKHREVDMSTRARSLIGKKINGWTIVGDKLEVVATKGDNEIRISGMCKKEDLLEQLED